MSPDFMDDKNNLRIYESVDALTQATAKFILETAKTAVVARGRFAIALSGGHTPEKLYSLLAQPPYRDAMPWSKTFVFWGDERCVPLDDNRNNARMAKTLLLDKVAIPVSNIFPIQVNLPPTEAAKAYEKTLHDFFGKNEARFDLILLGLGENGHTASLFPNTSVLDEKIHWVKEVYVDEVKMYRITMTAPLINAAHNIVFLVSGKGKADIFKAVYTPSSDLTIPPNTGLSNLAQYPAQLIKPVNGNLYWFIDGEVAMNL